MTKVLVSDPIDQAGIDILSQVAQVDQRTGLSPEELKSIIGEYDALMIRSGTQVTADVIAAAQKEQDALAAREAAFEEEMRTQREELAAREARLNERFEALAGPADGDDAQAPIEEPIDDPGPEGACGTGDDGPFIAHAAAPARLGHTKLVPGFGAASPDVSSSGR